MGSAAYHGLRRADGARVNEDEDIAVLFLNSPDDADDVLEDLPPGEYELVRLDVAVIGTYAVHPAATSHEDDLAELDDARHLLEHTTTVDDLLGHEGDR